MDDTGAGTEGTEIVRTQKDRLTEAAQEVVSGEAASLEGEDSMGITSEAEVQKGEVVSTPPYPTNMDRDCGAAVGNAGTEVGWRKERIDWGGGEISSFGIT